MPVQMDGYLLPPRFALVITEDYSGAPDLTLRFRVVDQRVECVAVELRTAEGDRELTPSDLRAIRLADLMEWAVELAAQPIEGQGMGRIAIGERRPGDRGAVRAVNRRRRRVNAATLEQVAEIVRTAEKPVDEIMQALGVERRAAQLWVKRARDGGYLEED
jgi:hypothetical protein